MTAIELINDDIKTLEAEKLIVRICRDHLNGMELDDIISKYVFEMKGATNDTRSTMGVFTNLRCAADLCEANRHSTWRVCREHGQDDYDQDEQRDMEKDND